MWIFNCVLLAPRVPGLFKVQLYIIYMGFYSQSLPYKYVFNSSTKYITEYLLEVALCLSTLENADVLFTLKEHITQTRLDTKSLKDGQNYVLNFKFQYFFIIINLNVNANSHMLPVATNWTAQTQII